MIYYKEIIELIGSLKASTALKDLDVLSQILLRTIHCKIMPLFGNCR